MEEKRPLDSVEEIQIKNKIESLALKDGFFWRKNLNLIVNNNKMKNCQFVRELRAPLHIYLYSLVHYSQVGLKACKYSYSET